MIRLDPALPASAAQTYELPLSLDAAMRAANTEEALIRYHQTGDPSPLVVPEDATRVVMRPLGTAEYDRVVEAIGDPPRLAIVLDEQLGEQLADLAEEHRADLEAIRIPPMPDDGEPDAVLLEARAAAERARKAALRRHQRARAALQDRVIAEWMADAELSAARTAMREWHDRRTMALVETCVVGVEPRAELLAPELLGQDAAKPWTPAMVRRWLALMPPDVRRPVVQELRIHAERLCSLGKAPAAASASPPGSPTTSGASGPVTSASRIPDSGATEGTAAAPSDRT